MARFLAPTLLALSAGAGCNRAGVGTEAAGQTATYAACDDAEARPAAGAPAEGVWLYHGEAHRVAAIVGPAQAVAGQAQVTRRVETVEVRPGTDTIRHASDTAAVRLQFLAPSGRPAAVYDVGPQVLLASYEPCPPTGSEPLIRYLRQDTAGRVATDVILERESSGH